MSNLKAEFEDALTRVQNLPERPDNDTLLKLYALYKQANEGDVTGNRPGGFDLVGAAKYDARAALKGTTSEAAMQAYVDLVRQLESAV